jgi:hypothetical protein
MGAFFARLWGSSTQTRRQRTPKQRKFEKKKEERERERERLCNVFQDIVLLLQDANDPENLGFVRNSCLRSLPDFL